MSETRLMNGERSLVALKNKCGERMHLAGGAAFAHMTNVFNFKKSRFPRDCSLTLLELKTQMMHNRDDSHHHHHRHHVCMDHHVEWIGMGGEAYNIGIKTWVHPTGPSLLSRVKYLLLLRKNFKIQ